MNNATMNEPTREELLAKIAILESKHAGNGTKGLGFKVTEKGGVSVYNLGRFPVTLYLSQWERLFAGIDDLKAFIEANRSKLAVKPEAK